MSFPTTLGKKKAECVHTVCMIPIWNLSTNRRAKFMNETLWHEVLLYLSRKRMTFPKLLMNSSKGLGWGGMKWIYLFWNDYIYYTLIECFSFSSPSKLIQTVLRDFFYWTASDNGFYKNTLNADILKVFTGVSEK